MYVRENHRIQQFFFLVVVAAVLVCILKSDILYIYFVGISFEVSKHWNDFFVVNEWVSLFQFVKAITFAVWRNNKLVYEIAKRITKRMPNISILILDFVFFFFYASKFYNSTHSTINYKYNCNGRLVWHSLYKTNQSIESINNEKWKNEKKISKNVFALLLFLV